jgi:hypothetical protein
MICMERFHCIFGLAVAIFSTKRLKEQSSAADVHRHVERLALIRLKTADGGGAGRFPVGVSGGEDDAPLAREMRP